MRHRHTLLLCLGLAATAQAADIGGWMEQKSRTELLNKDKDECAELIAQAARTPPEAVNAAQHYYASGLCYLYSNKVARDPVAAGAWLTRAAELEHPQARRALLMLRESPSTAADPKTPHCHDLGLGRKLCHGGASVQ
jgi:TPR repeat protein